MYSASSTSTSSAETNNCELQVNTISLGGNILSVDDNNNLLFNGKKVMLSD
jgi:hypothetical protein